MTEILTTGAADHAAAIGPGRLVLVVGPSGAGKDTLLGLARVACADDGNIVFPRRVITREASASEENEEVSAGTFQEALARGEYAMVEAGQNPQHRALAAAGWTDEDADLAGIERKGDAGNHVVPLARRVLEPLAGDLDLKPHGVATGMPGPQMAAPRRSR